MSDSCMTVCQLHSLLYIDSLEVQIKSVACWCTAVPQRISILLGAVKVARFLSLIREAKGVYLRSQFALYFKVFKV